MKYNEPVKAKYDEETGKVSISVSASEDMVVTRKVSVSEYRRIVAHMNAILHDVDNSEVE